jgi:hypothetical protein
MKKVRVFVVDAPFGGKRMRFRRKFVLVPARDLSLYCQGKRRKPKKETELYFDAEQWLTAVRRLSEFYHYKLKKPIIVPKEGFYMPIKFLYPKRKLTGKDHKFICPHCGAENSRILLRWTRKDEFEIPVKFLCPKCKGKLTRKDIEKGVKKVA